MPDMSKITIEEENLTSEEALARVSMILAKSENPKLLHIYPMTR
jgi:hypothetical protein